VYIYVFCGIIIAVVGALSIGGHFNPVFGGDIMTYTAGYTDHIGYTILDCNNTYKKTIVHILYVYIFK